MHFTKVQISELMRKHAEKENGLHDLMEIMPGSVPKSVSGKNPLKFVNFKCHCKFNVLFLIVL